jgi:hypothetical protein
MFFARRLREAGYHLDGVVVNRIHPPAAPGPADREGGGEAEEEARRLFRWLGERDRGGVEQIRSLLKRERLASVPLLPGAPTALGSLAELAPFLEDLCDGPLVSR